MGKVFINGIGAITAQRTFNNNLFLDDVIEYNDTVISAINPDYKEFIPPTAARRMAKGIKMSVVASKVALNDAEYSNVDAIITGTGMGCLVDSEKFVSAIIDNKEEFLTPTSFIQSTHNTVGGQIALGLECKGYNFTYVHSSISFESALLDAKLQLAANEVSTVLVGGVDELADHTVSLHKLIRHIKPEVFSNLNILQSKSEGAVFSEGAIFFALGNEEHLKSYAEVVDVSTYNTLPVEKLDHAVENFLMDNELSIGDIDVIVLGNNGDTKFDYFYNHLQEGIFKGTHQVCYKHLIGEFNTASSFGTWLGGKILKSQTIPDSVKLNEIIPSKLKTILLYNQYRGENHSFTLLKKC